MSIYPFQSIEKKWQAEWENTKAFEAAEPGETALPKYYVLDMFPYPSGEGLHVGHPLGYIAADIVARYKRHKGFNVLHPIGFDAFGLPAEQYAVQTGQHPAVTTEKNIARYIEQLKKLGFSFDWEKSVKTSDPQFYRFTQWIFTELFNSWYDEAKGKARPIADLISRFEREGNAAFSAEEWHGYTAKEQSDVLLQYRLAYLAESEVNWCPALGTVLANDEVENGRSERGGYPVERKKMKQWSLRITAYAERLLQGLDQLDWPKATKDIQRHWIGKSVGCQLAFELQYQPKKVQVFTTRPDTLFGVSFVCLAPEHELVLSITTAQQRAEVVAYVEACKNKSERERMTETKKVSGAFTGAFAVHPLTHKKVPIWIADYVLMGYGSGAVMGVPAADERDHRFASHFDLPVISILEGPHADITADDFDAYGGKMINSDFVNGYSPEAAGRLVIKQLEQWGVGEAKTTYKLRDAVFGRQRYWGEPIPIYYEDGIPKALGLGELPLTLPQIDAYKPTTDGAPPLGRAADFRHPKGHAYELTTMPGWAGSNWYFLRYMDPHNEALFAGEAALDYWGAVDYYVGGAEHATGHLLYARFCQQFLFDRAYVKEKEPFKKLLNQGMVQGRSRFVYRQVGSNVFVSKNLCDQYETTRLHVDIRLVRADGTLDIPAFKKWRAEFETAEFVLEQGHYHCGEEVEKMSKSKYNVINPDEVVAQYGADTLRLYEMFLGPIEHAKPWSTNGLEGVHRFLKKCWLLFYDKEGRWLVEDGAADRAALKALHTLIKKVNDDLENSVFNTAVSAMMICVNELNKLKCHQREVLAPFCVLLSPFAPHLAEELWAALGHEGGISKEPFPVADEQYLQEDSHEYPVMVNGKLRTKLVFGLDASREEISQAAVQAPAVQRWLEGKPPKKVIVVPKKIINLVV